jgi:hypothetical protein
MADNIVVTPGAGVTVAADEVADGTLGTVKVQFVKIMDGTLDGTSKAAVGANGLKVDGSAVNQPTYGVIQFVDVALSLDTSAYASGDVLADTQVVTGALRAADALGLIQSVMVLDEDDQGTPFTLYFLDANVSLGSENAAPSITDVNARSILGAVSVEASDYADLGGCKVAFKSAVGMVVKAASGTSNIYVAAVNGTGAPTYTASGLRLRIGVLS